MSSPRTSAVHARHTLSYKDVMAVFPTALESSTSLCTSLPRQPLLGLQCQTAGSLKTQARILFEEAVPVDHVGLTALPSEAATCFCIPCQMSCL